MILLTLIFDPPDFSPTPAQCQTISIFLLLSICLIPFIPFDTAPLDLPSRTTILLMRNINHFHFTHFIVFTPFVSFTTFISIDLNYPFQTKCRILLYSIYLLYLLYLSYFLISPPAQSYKNATFFIPLIPFIPFELLPQSFHHSQLSL